jgi:hypothetical protein
MPEIQNSLPIVQHIIPSDLVIARQIQDEIEEALHAEAYCDRDVFCIKLALEEALVNAVKHGNQMDPDAFSWPTPLHPHGSMCRSAMKALGLTPRLFPIRRPRKTSSDPADAGCC